MKSSIVTKIKNGTITLPKDLRREWREGEVVVMRAIGGFVVKSLTPPSLAATTQRLSRVAKQSGVTAQDVSRAVNWARKRVYAGRA